jgi:hypothetical protein
MVSGAGRVAVLVAATIAAAACTGAPGGETGSDISVAASFAQERCYRLIHHDTFAYAACLRNLLQDETQPARKRLGIEYFGWVGAVNSARLAMRGADATAREFLRRFRTTQKALGIDDQTLCASIPGDCAARIARMKVMEATTAPGPRQNGEDDDEESGHRD